MKKLIFLTATVSALFIVGCDQLDKPVPVTSGTTEKEIVVSDEGINGNRLASIQLQNGNNVNFYEFASGEVGVRHFYAADVKSDKSAERAVYTTAKKIEDLTRAGKPFDEIYSELAPEPKPAELNALRAAQLRHQKFQKQLVLDLAKEGSKLLLSEAKGAEGNSLSAPMACTPDYYNDNYGANWFLNIYCIEGAFRFCVTNNTWAYSGRSQTTWFKTSAMAADFATGARFRGWYWKRDCGICSWYQVLNWDYTVLARRIETWYFTGTGYRESQADGLAACPRVHFSALWNN